MDSRTAGLSTNLKQTHPAERAEPYITSAVSGDLVAGAKTASAAYDDDEKTERVVNEALLRERRRDPQTSSRKEIGTNTLAPSIHIRIVSPRGATLTPTRYTANGNDYINTDPSHAR